MTEIKEKNSADFEEMNLKNKAAFEEMEQTNKAAFEEIKAKYKDMQSKYENSEQKLLANRAIFEKKESQRRDEWKALDKIIEIEDVNQQKLL